MMMPYTGNGQGHHNEAAVCEVKRNKGAFLKHV